MKNIGLIFWIVAISVCFIMSTIQAVGPREYWTPEGNITRTGDIEGGNYRESDPQGLETTVGDSLLWDIVSVPVSNFQISPVSSKPDYDLWVAPFRTYLFDEASPETLTFSARLPPSWNRTATMVAINWTPTDTGSGNVAWKVGFMLADEGDVFTFAPADTVGIIDAAPEVAYEHTEAVLPPSGVSTGPVTSVAPNLYGFLTREADLNSDTYGSDVAFSDIVIWFKKDAEGSRYTDLK